MMFCAVLVYSRWRFVCFAADEKASTTRATIAEALGAIGGVSAKILADRMGCLSGGVVANVVVSEPDYVLFASYYGFDPISATVLIPNRRASWRICAATPKTTPRFRC